MRPEHTSFAHPKSLTSEDSDPVLTNQLKLSKRTSRNVKFVGIGAGAAAIVLIVMFLLMNTAGIIRIGANKTRFEGPGYATPEEAVTAYIDAIISMDLQQLWSTYAIETLVENYNFKYQIEKSQSYYLRGNTWVPLTNDLGYAENIALRLNNTAPFLSRSFFSELMYPLSVQFSDGYTLNSQMSPLPEEWIGLSNRQFSRLLEDYTYEQQKRLQSMEIVDILFPDEFARFAEKNRIDWFIEPYLDIEIHKNISQIDLFGADEILDLIIILNIDNEEYIVAPSVIRYGEKWRVLSNYSDAAVALGYGINYKYIASINELRGNN